MAKRSLESLVLRGSLVTIIVLTGTCTALWFRYVSAPSPTEICDHKIKLTEKATQARASQAGEKLIAKLRETCVESAKRRIRLEGKIQYATYARCVAAASTLNATEQC